MPRRYQRAKSFAVARENFLESSRAASCECLRINLNDYHPSKKLDSDLSIDISILHPINKARNCLVISSGLHGVEGFVGSEVQSRFMEFLGHSKQRLGHTKIVMIHAVNPYGFKYLRRWNEDGIDLNRNFLLDDEEYKGSPKGYADLNHFINPAEAPPRVDRFWLEAPFQVARHGLSTMIDVIATGQYDFPDGLFFGGKSSSASMLAIQQNLEHWLDPKLPTLHLDLHTGLGRWGELSFFLEAQDPQHELSEIRKIFPHRFIHTEENSAFQAQGLFGRWLLHRHPEQKYRFLTLEFGTFGMISLFRILRGEHQASRFLTENHPSQIYWRKQLLDYFSPPAKSWWRLAIPQGVEACWHALLGLKDY